MSNLPKIRANPTYKHTWTCQELPQGQASVYTGKVHSMLETKMQAAETAVIAGLSYKYQTWEFKDGVWQEVPMRLEERMPKQQPQSDFWCAAKRDLNITHKFLAPDCRTEIAARYAIHTLFYFQDQINNATNQEQCQWQLRISQSHKAHDSACWWT